MDKKRISHSSDFNMELNLKGFKVYEIDNNAIGHDYSRKDFYKINITTGEFIFHYADNNVETDGTFLFFANPHIPYSCEVISPVHSGFTCLFSYYFLKLSDRSETLLQSPFFKIGGTPIIELNKEQKESIFGIFKKMLAEQNSDYAFKGDLIRSYIHLIIHEALKMQPSEKYTEQKNAAHRKKI